MLVKRFSAVSVVGVGLVLSMVANGHAGVISNFTGYYAPASWTMVLGGDGSVDTSGAPPSIQMTSSDDSSGAQNVDFTIAIPEAGTIEFSWAYETSDSFSNPAFDPFYYLLDGIGIQLTDNSGDVNQSGSESIAVLAGQVFGFRQRSTDSLYGPAVTVISNFSGPAPLSSEVIPEPSTFVLLGLVLAGVGVHRLRRRRKA